MLGSSLLDRVRNEIVRRKPAILDLAWKHKLRWTRRLADMDGERWPKTTTETVQIERKTLFAMGGRFEED